MTMREQLIQDLYAKLADLRADWEAEPSFKFRHEIHLQMKAVRREISSLSAQSVEVA